MKKVRIELNHLHTLKIIYPVFGLGMCLSMKIIGDFFILGIIVGIIGIIGIAINYPLYKKILESSKEKYSYDILKLANEISESK